MSSIIKNVAVLALISSSVEAHRISQSANIGVRFIEQPKPEDSSNIMILDAPQKSAQDKLFDQMDKEEDEQSFGHSLEQISSAHRNSLTAKDTTTQNIDENTAYGSFLDSKFKAPVEQPKVAVVEVKKAAAAFEPKPTVGHFREQEVQLSQAEQNQRTQSSLVQAAIARTGNDKSNPEYQLAMAEAMTLQDGGIVDKELAKIDTDSENDAAIKKSLGDIVTDKEKNELIEKDPKQYLASQEQKGQEFVNDSSKMVFDPATASMVAQTSAKPMMNTLAQNKNSMEVHNNVPKAVMAEHGQISAVQANILKFATGAYPQDNITEIDE